MNPLIVIFVLFSVGLLLQHSKRFPEHSAKVLNQFAIYILLPALILSKIPFITVDTTMMQPVILAWLSMFVGGLLVYIASKIFHWSREILMAMLVVVPLGNTSFIGYPMIQALVGEHGLPSAILFDQLGTFIALIFYGSWMVAKFDTSSHTSTFSIIKKVIVFPPLWVMVLAFTFPSLFRAEAIHKPLVLIGSALVPTVVIALGMQFKLKLPSHNINPLYAGLTIKLFLMPFATFIFVSLMGWHGVPIQVSILESGMASMISAGAIVVAAGFATELVPALLSWGLLISFVTVPFTYWLLS